ncbi:MAG: hypothetical protein H7Z72_14865, partial [Bacteroidetes bacterium]|nr:hypothetical protein [Fibrella sp.]
MYPQALTHFRRALAYDSTDKQDRRTIAIEYFSLGNVYVKQGNPKADLAHYQQARQ